MRRGHIRAIAGACLAAVALNACGDSGDAATDIETTAPTLSEAESPTPTPTPEPVEETSEPLEVPEPDLTIESEADVEKVVREILDFRAWLFEHPDEGFRAETIFFRECGCYDELSSALSDLADDGRSLVADPAYELLSTEVYSTSDFSYGVTVEWRPGPRKLFDSEGNLLGEVEDFDPVVTENWLLTKKIEGPYRVRSMGSAG